MRYFNSKRVEVLLSIAVACLIIFYLVWFYKVWAILLFSLLCLFTSWSFYSFSNSLLQTCLHVLLFAIFPIVFLLSSITDSSSQYIVIFLYIPVLYKVVSRVVEYMYTKNKTFYAANLVYLYITPIILFSPVGIAYIILAGYAVVFWSSIWQYLLKKIPHWERVTHAIGLMIILITLCFYIF